MSPSVSKSTRMGTIMRAVGLVGSTGAPHLLREFGKPVPAPLPRDVIVRVAACSVNPIDTKMRGNQGNQRPLSKPLVLGFDGAGFIEALGSKTSQTFNVGDPVYFICSRIRAGCNADFVAVDERCVGSAPRTCTLTCAAALPLAAVTAWRSLFECARISNSGSDAGKRIMVLPGASGVGSMVIQLAKYAGLEVIAAASRPLSVSYAKSLGADHTVDHEKPLQPQMEAAGLGKQDCIDYVFSSSDLGAHYAEYLDLLKPCGVLIDTTPSRTPEPVLQSMAVKHIKYHATHEKFKYTESGFGMDLVKQGLILDRVSKLIDENSLQPPRTSVFPLCAGSLALAHRIQESGKVVGKIVMQQRPMGKHARATIWDLV